MIPELQQFLADASPTVRNLMRGTFDFFVVESGCTAYVKTIYVGFELDGTMVAAAYPHASSVEIALALPDDIEGAGLVDATHLTWRTMPVAVELRNETDLSSAISHFNIAVNRVRSGLHDVQLPRERFMGRDRHIGDPTILGKRS
jgi:hypothetical protein